MAFTPLLFDDSQEARGQGKILGGGMVGTPAGDITLENAVAKTSAAHRGAGVQGMGG